MLLGDPDPEVQEQAMAALRNLVEIHEQGAMALEWAGGGGRD